MNLAPVLFNLQNSDRIYVIDELDRSLHPHISRMFIETFLAKLTGGKTKGQLSFQRMTPV
jgi:AAA15 family ATPase/GTPase